MSTEDSPASPGPVAIVVLAAGGSRRFEEPEPKQLARVEGEPMVRRAVRRALAAELGPVFLVLGHRADEVAAAVEDLGGGERLVRRVDNPGWQEGQSTSVRRGLEAAARHRPPVAAALFLPCDQPALEVRLLQQLAAAWASGRGSIVRPVAEGRRGAPVVFDRRYFPSLVTLEGDQGGRQILADYPTEIAEVSTEPRQLLDIDTLDDLERWHATPRATTEPRP